MLKTVNKGAMFYDICNAILSWDTILYSLANNFNIIDSLLTGHFEYKDSRGTGMVKKRDEILSHVGNA